MTTAEKISAARKIRCPLCNAKPYVSCRRYVKTKLIFLKNFHAERINAAA